MSSSSSGKGLSALLGDIANTMHDIEISQKQYKKDIALNLIQAGSQQPRKTFNEEHMQTLIQSIAEQGLLQPIILRPREKAEGEADDNSQETYEIIAGERRFRACQQLNWPTIPAIVVHCNQRQALEWGLIENLQRADLDPIEEAQAYQRLMDEHSRTQEDIAKAVSKSRSHIANSLRLLNLSPNLQEYVRSGALTAGHARTLINNPDADALAQQMMEQKLSVRQAEKLTHEFKQPSKKTKSKPFTQENEDTRMLGERLTQKLGVHTVIKTQGDSGQIILHFNDMTELDLLIQFLDS